jgi:hypothetical protein
MAEQPNEADQPDSEPDADARNTFDLPALFCDAFFVTSWPGHVRISLGEYFDRPYYRTAVVLSLDDALELSKALAKTIARLQVQEKPKGTE